MRRAGLALLGLAVVTVAAATVILRGLDRPWVKRRIQAAARARSGLDIDYRATHARLLSGLRIDGLVVRSPEVFRGLAPELARVGTLEVRWTRSSVFGSGPALTAVSLDGVDVTLVRDLDGRTSLSEVPATAPAAPAPASPATPLSRIVSDLLAKAPAAMRITVERLSVEVIVTTGARALERLRIGPVALAAEAEPAGAAWRLRVRAGSEAAPLALAVTRTRAGVAAGDATARLWLDAALRPDGSDATVDLQVARQSFAPQLTVEKVAHVALAARFDPARGRTELVLSQGLVGDGAATAEATVELGDAPGAPLLVRRARGTVDLVRLLRLVPAHLVPVPLTARSAQARYAVEGLELGAVPRLVEGGTASAEGEIAGLTLASPSLTVAVDAAKVSFDAHPAGEQMALRATVPVQAMRLTVGPRRVAASALDLSLDGRVDREGTVTGTAKVGFAALSHAGPEQWDARGGTLAVEAAEVHVDPAAPLATRGGVEARGRIASLTFARGETHVAADGVGMTARARLLGRAPYGVDADLPVAHLRVTGPKRRTLVNGRARVEAHLSDVYPDAAQPMRTRAAGRVAVALDGVETELTGAKRADSATFDATCRASRLSALRVLAEGATVDIPWERVGLQLRTHGTVERLASLLPQITHHTELTLDRPAVTARGSTSSAATLAVVADSSGTARRHTGQLTVKARGLTAGPATLGDGQLGVTLGFDAAAPSIKVQLAADGDGPNGKVLAELGFDRTRKEVAYDVDANLAHLAPLAPLAASFGAKGFDLSKLALMVKGRGRILGLVDSVAETGLPRLSPRPVATAAADGSVELRALGVRWTRGDQELTAPLVGWTGTLRHAGRRKELHGALRLDALHIAAGHRQLDVDRVADALDVTLTGDLAAGEGELSHTLTLRSLRQDIAPGYPLGDSTFTLKAKRNTEGLVRIVEMRLDNPAGGTALKLTGGLDLGDERRSLSLRGGIEQNLAKVWSDPQVYAGRGQASVSLRVDSVNLSVFRTRAAIKVADGWFRLPRRAIEVEAFDGEVPVSADVVFGRRGARLLRDADVNAYSSLRFADQHPMLSRRSFISVKRIATPFLIAGPLAGNLKIEHNIVSLNQLDMGLRGGRLTGQCVLDWGEEDSTVSLHVRASKIEASQGEPFDGNAAVVVSVRDRSIEGRAEILRIGRRHLYDLLDLHDPHRADAAVNRVRRGLGLGYPDRVRLAFDHGFARVKITLGGLGRLVSIDELRGIPMGPIIDKALAKLSPHPQEVVP
ncbi:MAG TPA: hypothetical protein VMZ28_08970 [Kofleriaceae bacterium]|nr:hypothetical protein [Kofleriaceae bacterium]